MQEKNLFQPALRWRRMIRFFGLRRALMLYGPYLGAGVRLDRIDRDFQFIEVSMKLRWYNLNYVGTHFGGSLYSMTDPFYMFILMNRLGPTYIVWDKRAEIDFIRPGTGRVRSRFEISDSEVERIKASVEDKRKTDWVFETDILADDGKVVAHVKKTLYIRRIPGVKKSVI